MAKITFIGAGSIGFTRRLVKDLLSFPLLEGSTIALVDINEEHLHFAQKAVEKIIRQGNYNAKIETALDRREVLAGSDVVLCTILSHGVDVWRYDVEIPKQFGVDICVGDTRGPAGIFRALRTIPVMLDICHDIEKYCPDAVFLNYTNPMAMLCRAMQRDTSANVIGLCHSVQGTSEMLAEWIGAPEAEIDYLCAGINHQAWFLKFLWNGKDAYPLIREAIANPEIYNKEIVRNEMFLHQDYYVTESSGHNSEYNAWFRKRPDLIEKYCTHGTNWNPGVYAGVLKEFIEQNKNWKQITQRWLDDTEPLDLKASPEYAAYITNALMGGEPCEFYGNIPNTSLITNLPENACVEVPILANRRGFTPMHIGALPPQLAALNGINVAVEEMAVEGALTGNPRMIYHAIMNDPLTSAVLSLCEIKQMVQLMFDQNKPYLPQFKHFEI